MLLARSKQRIRARSILEMDYQALRDVCTDLPPRGRIARSQILKATLSKIQTLQEEVNRRRAQQRTAWQLQHARPPDLPDAGLRVNSQTCFLSGQCKIHLDKRTEQPAQFRGGSLPEVQVLWDSLQPGQSQHRLPGYQSTSSHMTLHASQSTTAEEIVEANNDGDYSHTCTSHDILETVL